MAWPVLGDLPAYLINPPGFFLKLSRTGAPILPISLAGHTLYLINEPALLRHVLQDNAANYRRNFSEFRPLFGDSMLMAHPEKWRKLRDTTRPAFSTSGLRAMEDAFRAAIETAIARLARRPEAEIDVAWEMSRLTIDVMLRGLFGTDLDAARPGALDALTDDAILLSDVVGRAGRDPLGLKSLFARDRQKDFTAAKQRLDALCDGIIRNGKSTLLSRIVAALDDPGFPEMTEQQARDEVIQHIIAGYETTSAALCWTLYFVARHGDVQERVFHEVAGAPAAALSTTETADQLPYLNSVFAESLRLCPPIWITSHGALEADTIGGVEIAPRTGVIMCFLALHRDPRFWAAPEEFRPERFSPEQTRDRPAYAYLPFGAGPKACIGARLARIETLSFVAELVRRFRLSTPQRKTPKKDYLTSLRPARGPRIRLHPRAD